LRNTTKLNMYSEENILSHLTCTERTERYVTVRDTSLALSHEFQTMTKDGDKQPDRLTD